MAGVAEVGKLVSDLTKALKSMAYQDSANVTITGGSIGQNVTIVGFSTGIWTGTITSAATIAAEAIKSGVLSLDRLPTNLTGKLAGGLTASATQILYDLIYPVGTPRMWGASSTSGLVWPGCTATWVEATGGAGAVLYVSSASDPNLLSAAGGHKIGDGTAGEGLPTTAAGGHTPVVQGHVLTTAELPIEPNIQADSGGTQPTLKTVSTRTADAHTHPAAAVPNHSHVVPLDVYRMGVRLFLRTA